MPAQLHATSAHALPRERRRSPSCKTASKKISSFSRLRTYVRCPLAQTAPRRSALFPVASVSGKTVGEYGNGGANSTGRTEYIWLPTDDGSAIPVGMFRGNRFYAVHTDHLGTPRLMTDDQAKPVWQWAYSAFGDNKPTGVLKVTKNPNTAITSAPLLNATNPAAVLSFRFPGQYWDSETGLAYNWHRYLMLGGGRYSQPDPMGLDADENRFGYSGSDAINSFDPDGLVKWTGSFRVFSLGIGKKIGRLPLKLGRNEITLNLESECINNKKVVVSLRVVNPDDSDWVNLPTELYGSGSVEMNDNQSTPNGSLLQGDFAMRLSGTGGGFGGKISSGAASGGFKRFGGLFFGSHNFTGRSKLLSPPKEVNCECEK